MGEATPLPTTAFAFPAGYAECMSPRNPLLQTPSRYRWIVDGHNFIFAVPRWERLQLEDRGKEAREGLVQWLEDLGRALGVQIWLAFDGRVTPEGSSSGAQDRPNLRVAYSIPPEEADDRIRTWANSALASGETPCVVTSDRRTLADHLPPGVVTLSPSALVALHAQVVRVPEKWMPAEDLEDVERHFLKESPFESDREAGQEMDEDSGDLT